MRSRRHTADIEETGIDLAPMLDFVLNLLIFFIITTSFVKEAGVTVDRPIAELLLEIAYHLHTTRVIGRRTTTRPLARA